MRFATTVFFIFTIFLTGFSQELPTKNQGSIYIDIDASFLLITLDAGVSIGRMFNENVGVGVGMFHTSRFNWNRRSKTFMAIGCQLKVNSKNKRFFSKHEIGFVPSYIQSYYGVDEQPDYIPSFMPCLKAQYGVRFGKICTVSAGTVIVPFLKEKGYQIEERNNGFAIFSLTFGFNFNIKDKAKKR